MCVRACVHVCLCVLLMDKLHCKHSWTASCNAFMFALISRLSLATACAGDLTRSPATPNHSLQYPADGSRPPSAAFKELGEKTSHEGKASGGVTFAEAKHKGIAAGHDVHFQKQPHNVGPNTPHKSGTLQKCCICQCACYANAALGCGFDPLVSVTCLQLTWLMCLVQPCNGNVANWFPISAPRSLIHDQSHHQSCWSFSITS